MSGVRLAIVLSHPSQHQAPLVDALAATPSLVVRALYATDHGVRPGVDREFATTFAWDVDLLGGHDHVVLRPGLDPGDFGFRAVDAPSLGAELDRFRPDVVWVHGYAQRLAWRAWWWAIGRAATLYHGDSEPLRPRPLGLRIAKQAVLRPFFAGCDAVMCLGARNQAYYRAHGVAASRLFHMPPPVDRARLGAAIASARAEGRVALRRRLGLPAEAVVALFAAKLVAHKRPLDLVAALSRLGARAPHLAVAGEGPLGAALAEAVAAVGLDQRVHRLGFVNQSRMPELLAASDLLVLPSAADAYPLIVVEALQAGLPLVVSDRVGCVGPTDAARPDVNALVYPAGDVVALAAALGTLTEQPDRRATMAAESTAIAPRHDAGVAARAVCGALRAVGRRRGAPWLHALAATEDEEDRPCATW
ncbi:MAG: glycosyltransferase family 4 protein [Ectothiorhodospiraceae bacterium]|nr:glycosyltransferase family 4 protein [Ectothiorhodospiraceae bacterium]